jgi:hypothetical protein
MPDLPSVTAFINSPPGQLVAGAALAGIVWKFFDKVEGVLTDQTKFQIAVWLVGIEAGKTIAPWPGTFAKIFDRVFGPKHLSWNCFWKSCVATYVSLAVAFSLTGALAISVIFHPRFFAATVFSNAIPDYFSLLVTRFILGWMSHRRTTSAYAIGLIVDCCATATIATIGALIGTVIFSWYGNPKAVRHLMRMIIDDIPRSNLWDWIAHWQQFFVGFYVGLSANGLGQLAIIFVCPAFFTTAWTALYAGSGFLLKAACRFDLGFDWFNRRFDIEKKPLSAIGLVAGAIVAMLYWSWAAVRHFHPAAP